MDDEKYVLREAEADAVTAWRAEQLLPYFEAAVAFELAARRRLDVHELVRLVGCGATPAQAAALAEPVS